MSRFLRLSNCVPHFMAAATLMAPSRGNDPDAGPSRPRTGPSRPRAGPSRPAAWPVRPGPGPARPGPGPARPGPGDAEGPIAQARKRQALAQAGAQAASQAEDDNVQFREKGLGDLSGEMHNFHLQRYNRFYQWDQSHSRELADLDFPSRLPVDLEKRNELYRRCNEVIKGHCENEEIRGIAVCVSVGGQQKMLYSYGTQAEDLKVQATPDLVGNISFLSKTFLIFILLKLHDELNIKCHDDNNNPDNIETIQDCFAFSDDMGVGETVTAQDPRFAGAQIQHDQDPVFQVWTPHESGTILPLRVEYDPLYEIGELLPAVRRRRGGEERYILPTDTECVRLDDLIYQRSGLKQYNTWFERNRNECRGSLAEHARYICSHVLNFDPGTERCTFYDQVNFELLAYLIELKAGRPYRDVMQDELVKLGLNNTFVQEPTQLHLNKTRGSQNEEPERDLAGYKEPVEYKNATYAHIPNKVGSEGLCSTVKDLDKFFNILMKCLMGEFVATPYPLLSDDASQMVRPYYLNRGDPCPYESIALNHGHISGIVNRRYGKGLIIDGVRAESPTVNNIPRMANAPPPDNYTHQIIFKEGEAMEGTSIAMLIMKCDKKINAIERFSQAEKDQHRRLRKTKKTFTPNLYTMHSERDLLTREIDANTTDANAEVVKYATVSIICTSRDKNLYVLGREIGEIAFKLYGIGANPYPDVVSPPPKRK